MLQGMSDKKKTYRPIHSQKLPEKRDFVVHTHTGGSVSCRKKKNVQGRHVLFFSFLDSHRRLVSTISICSNVEFRCAVTIATRVFTLSANIRHQVSITYSANNCPSRRSSSFGGNVDSYSSNPCGFCMQTK